MSYNLILEKVCQVDRVRRGIPSGSSIRLQCGCSDYYKSQNYCNFCKRKIVQIQKNLSCILSRKMKRIVSKLKWIMFVNLYSFFVYYWGILHRSTIQTGISLYCSEDPESIEWYRGPVSSTGDTQYNWERETACWGERGWARSRTTLPQESLVLYK